MKPSPSRDRRAARSPLTFGVDDSATASCDRACAISGQRCFPREAVASDPESDTSSAFFGPDHRHVGVSMPPPRSTYEQRPPLAKRETYTSAACLVTDDAAL